MRDLITPGSGEAAWSLASPAAASWLQRLYAAYRTAAERRRLRLAERQLESLDDRMLRDMGIGRSEIRRVVRLGRPS